MSIANYVKLERQGVTGPYTGTCLVAALDMISPRTNIPPEVYSWYDEIFQEIDTKPSQRQVRDVWMKTLRVVGARYQSLREHLIKTPEQCNLVLNNLRQGGFRIIFFTENGHVCGLIPRNNNHNLWRIVGTYTPIEVNFPLTPKDIFPHIYQPEKVQRFGGEKVGNLIAIDPENKH